MTEQQQSGGGLSRRTLISLAVVFALTGLWFGMLFFGGGLEPRSIAVDLSDATLLPQPKPLEDFTLVGQDGQPLGRDDLKGRWTFLAFGYTYCPDVCPTMMATFDALEQELAKSGAEPQAEFLFVSVDPERDTPQRVGEYVGYFNPRIQGATAGHEVLRPLTTQLGILYQRAEGQDTAMGYLVDHSASMLLLDPQARLSAIFGSPHNAKTMAGDFRTISSHGQSNP
jgi:protein SCO1/2